MPYCSVSRILKNIFLNCKFFPRLIISLLECQILRDLASLKVDTNGGMCGRIGGGKSEHPSSYAAFAAFVGFLAGGVTGISKADTFSDIVFKIFASITPLQKPAQ